MNEKKILVIGACGQIGVELVIELRKKYGDSNVIASDIKDDIPTSIQNGIYEKLNVLEADKVINVIKKYKIEEVYHMAALLSATAEKKPIFAWQLNMDSLLILLNIAKEKKIKKLFWPSSIAVFGPTTPRQNTPQTTIMEPSTVYGISKQAGERWCEYYANNFGVDVRSIRYPGLISYKSLPGGGTTDYAVDIFYKAKKYGKYTCFLNQDTALPMMYMQDAINATIQIMESPASSIKIRSSYNISGISFTPKILATEIKKNMTNFEIEYESDFRQKIADTWPHSIDGKESKIDWGWEHKFGIEEIVKEMLNNLNVELLQD